MSETIKQKFMAFCKRGAWQVANRASGKAYWKNRAKENGVVYNRNDKPNTIAARIREKEKLNEKNVYILRLSNNIKSLEEELENKKALLKKAKEEK